MFVRHLREDARNDAKRGASRECAASAFRTGDDPGPQARSALAPVAGAKKKAAPGGAAFAVREKRTAQNLKVPSR
jgi:hypothetical protein